MARSFGRWRKSCESALSLSSLCHAQKVDLDRLLDPGPSGTAGVLIVIKSGEWARPDGVCKLDTLTVMANGKSILDPAGSVTVCRALTMQQDWRSWRTRLAGSPGASTDGTRVTLAGRVRDLDQGCPQNQFWALPGDRLDFVFSLRGSGDGKAPTTMYIGKHSISVRGTDC
jgi:hypothetical protein